ncbi:hypothetical protein FRX31_008669 [Thalictrum thalictroides]|uniref:Uncharacterized protein n=1 Tax=Thalictrum thalictroides TaxID=46969 RepID=A0A7J6WXV9_THATH|nr:hypothetical protein FRX31_008669 [Thalictrum thalictroides]
MAMVSSTTLCYDSVPRSPSGAYFNQCALKFYSVPASPKGGHKTTTFVSDSDLKQEDIGSNSGDFFDDEDFEFDTSLNSSQGQQKQQLQHVQDVVSMAFADEIFCNGQIMPLKPPPRLHFANSNKFSNRSSCASYPTSPSSVLKGPLNRWSLIKSSTIDFDPFMVALEKVTNEARGRDRNSPHKRARSLSPLRSPIPWSNSNDITGGAEHQKKEIPQQHIIGHAGSTPGEQNEPRKATSANSMSKMHIKPTLTTLSGPTVKKSESFRKDATEGGDSRKGSKRFIIKDNVSPSTTDGKTEECDVKSRPHSKALIIQAHNLRNSSFNSMHKPHFHEQRQLANRQFRKKTLIPYKAQCMLVCLGFGHNGLRDLN